ncbi:MAG: bifunctional diaminohydroxyphosphoribosylaminopyrimidine deaminase/5-amino-6-(5-phosphoribosylamino)uracil reductase RibD [Candidatus Omnitrophica bacterium]|nr:bifunctional diaminohydroxyphosphoribosylaminopyrimidine deaminase/5-amino-6-(5-phosphoribosylamino)uracil reductase RibD [Candidatus Omnitrophota bacterium]
MNTDIKFMDRALALARRGMGRTSPNPMVGCVIVKNGRVIAEGYHHYHGGDHAEVDALKKAGAKAKGALMYVTLEPCAHWGKTPPCVDALIMARISKVVIAMKDPNPLTNGASIRKLRSKGIKVVVGVGEAEALLMNAPFIKHVKTRMPYVVVKTAQTMDGKAGTRSGRIKWITAEITRRGAALRRDGFDAIVVGVNTVLADDPGLNAPNKRLIKVVVDATLRTPSHARIFEGMDPGQVIMATTRKASPEQMAALLKRGAMIMFFGFKAGGVDLKALFKALAKSGLIRILVEGGPRLGSAVIKAGLADQMQIYIAPWVMGPEIKDAVKGIDVAGLIKKDKLDILSVERMGKDIFIEANYVHRHR